MWPANIWESVYEYFIRKAAGLGKSPTKRDPDIYDHNYYHCEVLVVGAGPAGLIAAKTAANTGKKVLLVDEKPIFGGNLNFSNKDYNKINEHPPLEWIKNICL